MARIEGLLALSGNWEPQVASSWDARLVVQFLSDLTNPDTFLAKDGQSYVYKGMPVAVIEEPIQSVNGLYLLKDLPHTEDTNWARIGDDSTADLNLYALLDGSNGPTTGKWNFGQDVVVAGSIEVALSTNVHWKNNPVSDEKGDWRIRIEDDDMVIERYSGTAWVEKMRVLGDE